MAYTYARILGMTVTVSGNMLSSSFFSPRCLFFPFYVLHRWTYSYRGIDFVSQLKRIITDANLKSAPYRVLTILCFVDG